MYKEKPFYEGWLYRGLEGYRRGVKEGGWNPFRPFLSYQVDNLSLGFQLALVKVIFCPEQGKTRLNYGTGKLCFKLCGLKYAYPFQYKNVSTDGWYNVCLCEHVCAYMCSGTHYILSTKLHILLPKWGLFEGSHLVRRLRLEPVWGLCTYLR